MSASLSLAREKKVDRKGRQSSAALVILLYCLLNGQDNVRITLYRQEISSGPLYLGFGANVWSPMLSDVFETSSLIIPDLLKDDEVLLHQYVVIVQIESRCGGKKVGEYHINPSHDHLSHQDFLFGSDELSCIRPVDTDTNGIGGSSPTTVTLLETKR